MTESLEHSLGYTAAQTSFNTLAELHAENVAKQSILDEIDQSWLPYTIIPKQANSIDLD